MMTRRPSIAGSLLGGAALASILSIQLASQTPNDPYAQWDVTVRPGTSLDTLKVVALDAVKSDRERGMSGALPEIQTAMESAVRSGRALALDRPYTPLLFAARIPPTDLEDRSPLPLWYRAFIRRSFPLLVEKGRYQYPRATRELLEWMLTHQDLKADMAAAVRAVARSRTVTVGGNINVTNLDERNSESSIAVDYQNPQFVVAASNAIKRLGHLKQFYSGDGGANWGVTELPASSPDFPVQCDPSVAVAADGTVWTATLGLSRTGNKIQVEMYKSVDHGKTFTFQKTLSTTTNNDKEMLAIDTSAASPFKNHLYVAWDVPSQTGGIRFSASPDNGATWSAPATLSTDQAIGVHVAIGPAGEVYVAWPDTASREIRLRKSTDGGRTFAPVSVITKTNASYEVSIPAMCKRNVLVYVSLSVDRSSGPRKGTVYASWTDREGTVDPECSPAAGSGNTNVYVAKSTDGGAHWSTPGVVHGNPANTDQFNQWLDVDPDNGNVHVMFYDTRADPARKKTDVYYVASKDGGATWVDETKVTTAQTDETMDSADLGNQYGDYNGLAVYRSVAHPVWTDRRNASGKEQIFTATLGGAATPTQPAPPPPTPPTRTAPQPKKTTQQ